MVGDRRQEDALGRARFQRGDGGGPERIDHDALDVRLQCGYSYGMATITRTMHHVMQSGPCSHARSWDGVYPFSVYRSHKQGVAERHARTKRACHMGCEVAFEVVAATATTDADSCRPDGFWSTNEVSR